MAKKQKPQPSKKYTPDEVLERFRAKDDPELGRYATYAAAHRAKLAKVSEKEKARQEKELKKQEAQKKQFEKAVTPEQLYQETAEAAVYDAEDDDGDMPSSDIKGKIFSNYQPLSSPPSGKEAPKNVARVSSTASAPKPSVRDLTRLFNQKFAEQKKEEEKQPTGKKQKKETKKVTKKIIRKTSKPASTPSPTTHRPLPAASAPPLPPAKKVDVKYVKQQHEELKKQQDKEEKAEEQKAKADERTEATKKDAEKSSAADPRHPTPDRHRSPFKTGFWIMCGVFAFLIILILLFFAAVAAISYLSGVPLVENGTIVLP